MLANLSVLSANRSTARLVTAVLTTTLAAAAFAVPLAGPDTTHRAAGEVSVLADVGWNLNDVGWNSPAPNSTSPGRSVL